jgi:hypothetical protein
MPRMFSVCIFKLQKQISSLELQNCHKNYLLLYPYAVKVYPAISSEPFAIFHTIVFKRVDNLIILSVNNSFNCRSL